jgi:DNA polymerase III sliding clamp (beta) subunit (PCNA family)
MTTLITTARAPLSKALKHGASLIESSGIEVLSNACLSVARGQMDLTFTDMSIWLTTSLPAKADAITATTIPAQLLSKAVDALEGADVERTRKAEAGDDARRPIPGCS